MALVLRPVGRDRLEAQFGCAAPPLRAACRRCPPSDVSRCQSAWPYRFGRLKLVLVSASALSPPHHASERRDRLWSRLLGSDGEDDEAFALGS